jgi:hypothetical protein
MKTLHALAYPKRPFIWKRHVPLARGPWRRRRRARAVVKPPIAVSALASGPSRDEAHLARVRRMPCLVSGGAWDEGWQVVAHHPDELFPRQLMAGLRISDYFAVPLKWALHDPATPGSVHRQNNIAWWTAHGWSRRRVLVWLRDMLRRTYPQPNEKLLGDLVVLEAEIGREGEQ